MECGFSGWLDPLQPLVFRIPKPFLIEFITASSAVPEFDRMIKEARGRLGEAREGVHRERYAELQNQSAALDPERDELAGRLAEILDKQADLHLDMVNEVRQSGDGDEANSMFVSGNGTRDWLELTFARWLLR